MSILQPILFAPSASALSACSSISSSVNIPVYSLPVSSLAPEYVYAKTHYYSATNADNTPACVVFPTAAEHVSGILRVLDAFPDVGFAVKSGGHNPNKGFSSTDGAVLISFKDWNKSVLKGDGGLADVSPGARWENVISDLEDRGRAVVGGRIGDVGVGLLLGGGLSFLSTQYGLACDSGVNYEVVLANSTIVNANENENSDLFWALKGGGNQFGIITKYTMKTFPISQTWGGVRTYSFLNADKLLAATSDWTGNLPDPKGSVIVTGNVAADNVVDIFVVYFFYDGPIPPPGVFDKFDIIPAITDDTKTRSYSDLLLANNELASIYGFRFILRAATIPNLPGQNGTDLYVSAYNLYRNYLISQGLDRLFQLGFVFSISFQPFPHQIPFQSQIVNPHGNPMNLSAADGDKMWIGFTISWLANISDSTATTISQHLTESLEAFVEETYPGVKSTNEIGGGEKGAGNEFVYFNDAMSDQRPLESYGKESYERLRAIQRRYDPDGMLRSRTGGFKYV
ncbi:hypothetical protein HYALB_00000898 [Hymenoscyphus albidus]|uniref:FAD-binding PCMH-type domain-containing protein n=1 Tax=Hymenoscyphus albidus TaxID=595503 RepID=A0A9N9Q0R2_9HELO|nr:hypothetical protein HYALB_00000898 [Hymenoscyphus albidus]